MGGKAKGCVANNESVALECFNKFQTWTKWIFNCDGTE
jgi:hypothetical protein